MEIELFGEKKIVTEQEFDVLKKKHNLSVDKDGNLTQNENVGVIPKLLSSWFAQRKEMRKLSKKYHDEGNKELEEYYDRKQYTWKILLNSTYGAMGLPVWRFFDIDNASAVTVTGVTIIQTTGKLINQYYRNVIGKKYVVKFKDGTTEVITEKEKQTLTVSNTSTPKKS